MLKILALHGYTGNGALFRRKLSAIRKQCGPDVEFYWADGPMILAPTDMAGFQSETTTAQLKKLSETDPEMTPRAWWRANDAKTVYWGTEESVEYAKRLMIEHQFDGVFGFSQGAAFAGLLCAMLERPHLYPQILVDGKLPQPPFKFGIFAGGFKPVPAPLAAVFSEGPVTTPTLHVIGKNDVIVYAPRSQMLIDACQNPRVEQHDGGHFVPSAAPWRNFFRDYIKSFDAASTISHKSVPSPSAPAAAEAPALTSVL
ncbi:hypothetical protein FRB90_001258 [Tulasnella sp. 427]|nr:hypothetical protein FRB90_001258 [Tulasnella sp. 427]